MRTFIQRPVAVALTWPALGQQAVEIIYVWKSERATEIYSNGRCADGLMADLLCDKVAADDIYDDVREVYGAVGKTGGEGGTVDVSCTGTAILTPRTLPGNTTPTSEGMGLRHDWMNTRGIVHREMDTPSSTSTSEPGPATARAAPGAWSGTGARTRGMAMVIQEAVGGVHVGSPRADTVEGIVGGCHPSRRRRTGLRP